MALTAPVEIQTPVAGTTAGIYEFQGYVKGVTIDSGGVSNVLVRLGEGTVSDENGGYHFRLSGDGIIVVPGDIPHNPRFNRVSVWVPSGGDVDKIRISGEQ